LKRKKSKKKKVKKKKKDIKNVNVNVNESKRRSVKKPGKRSGGYEQVGNRKMRIALQI
jgi:hypothetical protein